MFIQGLLVVFFLKLFTGCAKKEPVVARIGRKEVITLMEFEEDFSKGKSRDALKSAGLTELKAHLDGMIARRIKVLAAYEEGLDDDSTVIASIEHQRQRFLLQRLYDTEIVDRFIHESDIREFYARMGKEVVIRTIFFKLSSMSKPEEEEEVRARADSVLQRIRAGEDFATLAIQFSEDKKFGRQGGLLGALSWTRSNDPIRNAVFSLDEGEVSDLVRSRSGYNIVKVEEIRDKGREPYGKVRDKIRRQLVRDNYKLLSDKAKVYWNEVMEKNRVQWREDELAALGDRMAGIIKKETDVPLDSLEILSQEGKEKILVQYLGGSVTTQEFLERMKMFNKSDRMMMSDPRMIKEKIERRLIADMLSEIAKKKGLDKDRVVVEGIRETLEQEMVRLLDEQIIDEEMQPTEEDIKNYYEKFKSTKYAEPEKVKVQEVFVGDEVIANSIVKWAKAGRDFSRLAQQYTERPGFKKKDGILDFFPRGRWGNLGVKAFELKAGEIAGAIPVKIGDKQGYSVIKLLDKRPIKVKPLEDVRDKVSDELKNDNKKTSEKVWLAEQKKKFNVWVYEEVLKGAFQDES